MIEKKFIGYTRTDWFESFKIKEDQQKYGDKVSIPNIRSDNPSRNKIKRVKVEIIMREVE